LRPERKSFSFTRQHFKMYPLLVLLAMVHPCLVIADELLMRSLIVALPGDGSSSLVLLTSMALPIYLDLAFLFDLPSLLFDFFLALHLTFLLPL
jgi:hypothetical protein